MQQRITIAIVGHGNLGRGAEASISQSPDLELVGIVTRRDPDSVRPADPSTPVIHQDDVDDLRGRADVLLCCGGSKDDLPVQVPDLARRFTVVDSFDTHARINEHFDAVDAAAREGGTIGLIATGWDPGLFSLNRLYGEAILPAGATYTFWGRGLSQGHSDAVRRVPGVAGGVQYTIPSDTALDEVRSGSRPDLTPAVSHRRECFVVLEEGADAAEVERAIVTLPDYFAPYETTVTFIDAETLERDHAAMPHGGIVLRSASTADGAEHTIEYRLRLGHNPSFTASVLTASARAAHRLAEAGETGARTLFDIAPGLLSPRDPADLRRDLL